MAMSLIRSRAMVSRAIDRNTPEVTPDGAVLQEDGVILALGRYDDLKARYPDVAVLGTGNEVLMPGFVNGHHHVGLTPLEVLTCATRTGAEILGCEKEFGTLEPGKLADVLVVEGNVQTEISLLEDRSRFLAVLQGGVVKAGRACQKLAATA